MYCIAERLSEVSLPCQAPERNVPALQHWSAGWQDAAAALTIAIARQLAVLVDGLYSKLIVLEQLLKNVLAFMLSMIGLFYRARHQQLIRLYKQSCQAHSKQTCKGAGGQCTSHKKGVRGTLWFNFL